MTITPLRSDQRHTRVVKLGSGPATAAVVRFDVDPFESSSRMLVPVVDDVPLTDRVEAFAAQQGFDVAGGYAGLVVDRYRFGDLTDHLVGRSARRRGRTALLGCECGELGCWPFEARGGCKSAW